MKKDADLILEDGLLIPVTSTIKKGNIIIKDGEIIEINEKAKINEYEGKKIDLEGKAVLPGLINTHTHVSMTLLRGIADDLALNDWLNKLRPLESEMDEEDIYAGALLGILEMIKNGVTNFSDMYFHMDEVAKAAEETCIRADLGYGMVTIDKDKDGVEKELEKGINFFKKFESKNNLIDSFIAPHSISTCSIDFLKRISDLDIEKIQMHVAETRYEFEKTKKEYKRTPIQLLEKLGLLDKNFLAAHCVHLGENDLKTIREKNVKVSHNPNSNMKLASGIASVSEMNKREITVSLGTDGAASNNSLDIFQEMKSASLLQKIYNQDATTLDAMDVLKMATVDGARALDKEEKTGSIEEGKKADLVIVDLKKPVMNPINNVVSNLVYSGSGDIVESVIVDGELVVHENSLLTLDEASILKRARKRSNKLKEVLK